MLSLSIIFLPVNSFLNILCSRFFSFGWITRIHSTYREHMVRYIK